jgi:hypothetical protein
MLTTALGLAVALPTMVAHSYLVARVDRYEAQLQDGTVTFLKSIEVSDPRPYPQERPISTPTPMHTRNPIRS